MITLRELAGDLEAKLNDSIKGGDYFVNSFTPNEKYEFNIVLDAGEYKKATRVGNEVTKYINGVITLDSDEKAGIHDSAINASISAIFEFIIPDVDKTYDIIGPKGELIDTITFKDAVRELVDDTLSASEQYYMQDEAGNYFLVTSSHSFANPGTLEIRYQTGNSLTMTVLLEYAIVASGFSAASIEMWVNQGGDSLIRIYPARLDVSRSSVQEGVIRSDRAVSETLTQTTQLTIGITKPLRCDAFDNAAMRYIFESDVTLLGITLKYPTGISAGGDVEMTEKTYTLSFAEASVAGEQNLAVPVSATLHEEVDDG